MQLKVTRSQRDAGIISTTAIFCIDARVAFTAQEHDCIKRYKLGKEVVYDSQSKNQLLERSDNARNQSSGQINYQGSVGSMLGTAANVMTAGAFRATKSLAFAALASMKLSITINSLTRGQHVECKSLDELLGAEEAIMTACQNLKTYLDTAATFDGREVLFDFENGEAQAVARSISPDPILLSSSNQVPLVAGSTVPESAYVEAEYDDVYQEAPNLAYQLGSSVSNLSKHPERIAIGIVVALLLLATVYFVSHGPSTSNATPVIADAVTPSQPVAMLEPGIPAPTNVPPHSIGYFKNGTWIFRDANVTGSDAVVCENPSVLTPGLYVCP